MRTWAVAAVVSSLLLAIGTTVVLLSGADPGSVVEGPYANMWIMPYPGGTSFTGTLNPRSRSSRTGEGEGPGDLARPRGQ